MSISQHISAISAADAGVSSNTADVDERGEAAPAAESIPPAHPVAQPLCSAPGDPTADFIDEKRRATDGAPVGLIWGDGARAEVAANRGEGDTSSPAGHEFSAGTRGEKSGMNYQQMEAVSGKPGESKKPPPATQNAQK